MSSNVLDPALPTPAAQVEPRAGWQRLMLLPLVILAGMGLSVEAGLLGPLGAQVGQALHPRAVLHIGLFGARFALNSSTPFAQSMGLPRAPVDSLLAFHMVFGKTVADISLNAIANLGYAGGRFGAPLFPGDTVATDSPSATSRAR